MEQKAIDYIKKYEPPEGYFVGFSGGKDSIVTLDLVRRAGVKHRSFYSNTLIDPPEVVSYIKEEYPDVIILRPRMTFWQGMMRFGVPIRQTRWCCDLLKKDPARKIPEKQRIFGIRAEESIRRRARGKMVGYKNQIHHHPLFEWNSGDVWDYIRKYSLRYCKLYDEGFTRIGCMVCPFITRHEYQKYKQKWPHIYRLLEMYLRRIWERDKVMLQSKYYFTMAEYLQWPLWRSKKERIKEWLQL